MQNDRVKQANRQFALQIRSNKEDSMGNKRVLTLVLVATLLLAAAGAGIGAVTRTQAQQAPGETVPYAGRLTDELGVAVVDGVYDLRFELYAAETGGEPLWSEIHSGITVVGGAFGLVLGSQNSPPKDAFLGSWLQVSVRGPGEASFTPLAPRQRLVFTLTGENPDTTSSCAHDHYYENWTGANNYYGLRVENTGTGDGIRGVAYSNASDFAGIVGANYLAGPGVYGHGYGGGPGVAGYSTGRGVYGKGLDGVMGESGTDNKSGVYGYNTAPSAGYGVTGRSENNFGVFAWGNDTNLSDKNGDIVLQGEYGEIFSFGGYLDLFSNGNVYIELDDDNNSNGSWMRILSGNDGILWSVSESAGVLSTGKQATVIETADQGQRLMYAVEGTGVWLEDLGTASLDQDGETTIIFDPVYAQAADLTQEYQVFVTALSDQPVLLVVSAKMPEGFTVRGVTLDGKPAACKFDYRVTAPRRGYVGLRTEQYQTLEKVQP